MWEYSYLQQSVLRDLSDLLGDFLIKTADMKMKNAEMIYKVGCARFPVPSVVSGTPSLCWNMQNIPTNTILEKL